MNKYRVKKNSKKKNWIIYEARTQRMNETKSEWLKEKKTTTTTTTKTTQNLSNSERKSDSLDWLKMKMQR